VRGYPSGTLFGQRAATASVEYRVPLALIGQGFGHLPLGIDRLWLSAFGDVGDAWEPGAAARLHRLRSVGVELVADLTVSYDLPLGLRLGVAQPLVDPPAGGRARVRAYAAVGSDF
jgi:hemolysin activation/secretion protein